MEYLVWLAMKMVSLFVVFFILLVLIIQVGRMA